MNCRISSTPVALSKHADQILELLGVRTGGARGAILSSIAARPNPIAGRRAGVTSM